MFFYFLGEAENNIFLLYFAYFGLEARKTPCPECTNIARLSVVAAGILVAPLRNRAMLSKQKLNTRTQRAAQLFSPCHTSHASAHQHRHVTDFGARLFGGDLGEGLVCRLEFGSPCLETRDLFVSGGSGAASDKIGAMQAAGYEMAESPADIGNAVTRAIARAG